MIVLAFELAFFLKKTLTCFGHLLKQLKPLKVFQKTKTLVKY